MLESDLREQYERNSYSYSYVDNTEFPDTLVLYISDTIDNDKTGIYILYDQSLKRYIIRGYNYAFECCSSKDLTDFLLFTIKEYDKFRYELCNYTDLPLLSRNITYDTLQEMDFTTISFTESTRRIKKKKMVNMVKMLKHVYNKNH
jgi:hypothetical protein